ncbi:hypothetical protein [Paraglaciecola sp.]|uniref:hypothetical protein n=1 Tax=Paraglaciecola sp. TaxID=1920173 RepID=UPI0027402FDE|nr:hypothetical protein [Paraglaciecola sp.]MDP5030988.1 hypothetical protein [Paraglaciecola sp.]
MGSILVISCWFGERFQRPIKIKSSQDFKELVKYFLKSTTPLWVRNFLNIESVVPKAPQCYKALFFTNNRRLKAEIISKGWTYQFWDGELGEGNSVGSSLLAKKVKFLQFSEDFIQHNFLGNYVVYLDSRRITDQLSTLFNSGKDAAVLIRYTPRSKTNIWEEVEEAKEQERYLRAMPQTIEYINRMLSSDDIKDEVRICNTGVIAYNFLSDHYILAIRELTNSVYETCLSLGQPECQIIWAIESQKYQSMIKHVEFDLVHTRDQ